MAERSEITAWLDQTLGIPVFPDFPGAWNGLQLEGKTTVERVAWAVDACPETVLQALAQDIDLLLVHHGMFWEEQRPLAGPAQTWILSAVRAGLNLYSAHLPLDGHRQFGNAAILADLLALQNVEPFGVFEDHHVGVRGTATLARDAMLHRLETILGAPVRGAPATRSWDKNPDIAIATGSASSYMSEALASGCQILLTGEASHHRLVEARSRGIELWLGGHYATEIFGVKSIAEALKTRFDVEVYAVGENPLQALLL